MTAPPRAADDPIPPTYAAARGRFRELAGAAGARLEAFPFGGTGPDGTDLSTDAAVFGSDRPRRVLIVSSGLHGVEGFFGSGAQAAWMARGLGGWSPGPGEALVFLHALNPHGFAWVRRFDEANVDPNRNFLLDGQAYEGSPPLYARFNGLLNPERPPGPTDLFTARAVAAIVRHGMPALKAAVAGGQYDFPRGLFFGGHTPATCRRVLAENLPRWVGDASHVLHVDFHTGLGRWATYRLLLDPGVSPDRVAWARRTFGAELVEHSDLSGVAYPTRGDIGTWCRSLFPGRTYDALCAEFGTYRPLRVLAALRAENQAHHGLPPGSPAYERAKRGLKEAFAPGDRAWRADSVAQAVDLLDRSVAAVFPR